MHFSKAVELAAIAHGAQTDLSGEPYLLHPITVAVNVFAQTHSVDAAVVAILHDTVEDTYLTLDMLVGYGLSDDQLRALDALTRRSEESYEAHIERVIREGGPIAKAVKKADLEHNMDLRRLRGRRQNLPDKDVERLRRYAKAWTELSKL